MHAACTLTHGAAHGMPCQRSTCMLFTHGMPRQHSSAACSHSLQRKPSNSPPPRTPVPPAARTCSRCSFSAPRQTGCRCWASAPEQVGGLDGMGAGLHLGGRGGGGVGRASQQGGPGKQVCVLVVVLRSSPSWNKVHIRQSAPQLALPATLSLPPAPLSAPPPCPPLPPAPPYLPFSPSPPPSSAPLPPTCPPG